MTGNCSLVLPQERVKDLIAFLRQQVRLCIQFVQHKPFVYTTRDTRSLHFDLISVQSEMRRDAPDELVLSYTRMMMGFLLFQPAPRAIAMIGLGGGSLPKYCCAKFPDVPILVAEINPAVIALRDLFCIPPDNERFQIKCEDGAHFVRTVSGPIDVLLVDGFDRKGQSPQLCSERFYEDCFQLLPPGGVMVVNLALEDPLLAQSIERIHRRFPNTVVVNSEDCTNRIAFAPKGAVFDLSHEQLCARLGWLEHHHQVGLGRTLQRIRDAQYRGVRQPLGSVAALSDRRAVVGPSGPGPGVGVQRLRRR
jgi:spermidine synthase